MNFKRFLSQKVLIFFEKIKRSLLSGVFFFFNAWLETMNNINFAGDSWENHW